MATSVKTVADRVFNLLKGYGFQIDTYNKEGEVVGDPGDAIRFFVEDPNLLVTLNVPKEEIRLSISANTDQTDTLRNQLTEIAKDYLMMLDFRVFGKTLKPSSEAINISREADMKEHNRMRKLAGLETIKEDRTVVGCNDDQSLYMFLGNEQINLGKTPQEIGEKLKELKPDFSDMYYSSTMDFATECGFENDDSAKELMDAGIQAMNDDDVFEDEENDSEYENDLAMEFVKLPLASMSKEEIRSEMSDIFNTLYAMGMGDEPQTDAGNAMEDLGTSVEDSGEYVNDDWTYPSTSDGEISDNDVQTIIKHQQTVKDVIGHASLDQDPKAPELFNSKDSGQNEELNVLRKRAGLEEKEDNFVYASELIYFDEKGKEIGYMDFDGYDDANTDKSEEELQAMAQHLNIKPEDGKVVGFYDASDDEIDFSGPSDETYPDGTIGVFIDSHNYPKDKDKEMEEAEKSVEDCIRKTLEKEGGAAGLSALEDACKEAGFDGDVKKVIASMSDVKEHEHGDFILEGKNCGCGQNPCKTYGTKKESVEETIVVEASLGSMRGSIKTSNQPLGGTKIIVKHTKAVNEEVRGSRSRNIQKIFIENNEERFLFPSKNLNGARAMARHLYNGGQMHDTVGESIVAMCTELKTLKEFANYVKKQGLINEENNDYVELARQHISTIKETFKKLSGVKTYSKAVESLKDMNNIDVVNEVNLEDHFTETHFDDKVGKVHETISKLVNKQTAFESMIMATIESENFAGVKELISEDPMDFATPEAKLGHQVSQLGSTAKSPQLANYLGSISNKLSNGGQMNQFEYRAVKASLLSAQRTDHAEMAHTVTEEEKYTDFINSFIKD